MAKKHTDDFSEFENPEDASVRRLIIALDRAYHRPWLLVWRSFLHGFMTAIGAFVGTAVIGVLSVYLFQVLGGFTMLQSTIKDLRAEMIENISHR